jgi:hypothetical protein
MAERTDILTTIHFAMEVYDEENRKIGTVKYVKLPEDSEYDASEMSEESLRNIIKSLNAIHLPLETRERLLQDGFVVVDTGLLRADVYVQPHQIRSVSVDRIMLRVKRDEIL